MLWRAYHLGEGKDKQRRRVGAHILRGGYVVSENEAKAESRSESAVRRMEGKAEADASARRMDS